MQRPTWAPAEVDLERPSVARVYDYYLGGWHNVVADREMGDVAIADWPDLPRIVRANRAFLRRAVRFLADAGIDQFLDIGSGIPTAGHVREVAQAVCPHAHVVYVDHDPVAVAHAEALLADDPRTGVLQGDVLDLDAVLGHPVTTSLLDLRHPVDLLMVALLHVVGDEHDPAGTVARYGATLATDSHLVLSHASRDGRPGMVGDHQALYRRTATPMTMRSHAEVLALFSGFGLVEPGLVFFPLWRPDPQDVVPEDPGRMTGYAGVGRRD